MDLKRLILTVIQQEKGGTLQGRTLLQKKLYFCSVLLKEDLGFSPHYYGPYSPVIADALDSLVTNGLLNETTETFPDMRNIFGERRRHTYTLTKLGKQLLEQRASENTLVREAMTKVNNPPVADDFDLLSIAAKVYFILGTEKKAPFSRIAQEATNYGWNVSPEDIEKVADYLVSLGLVVKS